MNTALLKAKMDKFFAQVTPEYLVQEFEKMGYNFIDSDIKWDKPDYYNVVTRECLDKEPNLFYRFFGQKKKSINEKKLTSEYPGSFFCLKIAL